MNKISSYIIIKKEIEFDKPIYRAYFRGTNNRIRRDNGTILQGYSYKTDLLFDIRNNPMERGVVNLT